MTDASRIPEDPFQEVIHPFREVFAELHRRIQYGEDLGSVTIDLEDVDPQRAYEDYDEWELAALRRSFEDNED